MSDVTIPGLSTQLTSVDRAADLLEVSDTSDSGNSKKSSVNNLLDLTSHPVGVDDVQTLTNKTLTAPTISSPVLSGSVTGTYTLAGTPTFPSAVVTLTGSQTLTNKVLTSPTINTATVSNPTLTVDTVSEFTAANGVTVDGVLLKDSDVSANDSTLSGTLSVTGNSTLSGTLSVTGNSTLSGTLSTVGQLSLQTGTAPPAAGATTSGIKVSSTANLGIFWGSGAPTFSAAQGAIYLRTNGSSTSTRLYVNTTGATTWTNFTSAT